MRENENRRDERIRQVQEIFEEHGFGNVELLEGWDGDDLRDLSDLLTEDELQILLDRFEDADAPSAQ